MVYPKHGNICKLKLTCHNRTDKKNNTIDDVLFHGDNLPDVQEGDIIEIQHPREPIRLPLKVFTIRKDLSPSKGTISIETTLATTFHFKNVKEVFVSRIDPEQIALDCVEVEFKDQYCGRCDHYHVMEHMKDTVVHYNDKLDYPGLFRGQVGDMWRQGERVYCGYVGPNTRVIFRSSTSTMHIFIQMSCEMWNFNYHGDLLFEKALQFLTELFQKWKDSNCVHDVTVILFSRMFYEATCRDQFPEVMRMFVRQDAKGRFYEDFYHVIVQNERYMEEWSRVLLQMRSLLQRYMTLVYESVNPFKNELQPTPRLINSNAIEGNLLEALNLTLNLYEAYNIDRNFDRTGKLCFVITPGSGLLEVDKELMDITKQRLLDLGVGMDMVFLGEQPLHAVPLFRFIKKRPQDLATPDDYYIPHWMNHSFYRSASELRAIQLGQFVPRIKFRPHHHISTHVGFHENSSIYHHLMNNNNKIHIHILEAKDMRDHDNEFYLAQKKSRRNTEHNASKGLERMLTLVHQSSQESSQPTGGCNSPFTPILSRSPSGYGSTALLSPSSTSRPPFSIKVNHITSRDRYRSCHPTMYLGDVQEAVEAYVSTSIHSGSNKNEVTSPKQEIDSGERNDITDKRSSKDQHDQDVREKGDNSSHEKCLLEQASMAYQNDTNRQEDPPGSEVKSNSKSKLSVSYSNENFANRIFNNLASHALPSSPFCGNPLDEERASFGVGSIGSGGMKSGLTSHGADIGTIFGSGSSWAGSCNTAAYSRSALYNPFASDRLNVKVTMNRRRWAHVFPLDKTGNPILPHVIKEPELSSNTRTRPREHENFADVWSQYHELRRAELIRYASERGLLPPPLLQDDITNMGDVHVIAEHDELVNDNELDGRRDSDHTAALQHQEALARIAEDVEQPETPQSRVLSQNSELPFTPQTHSSMPFKLKSNSGSDGTATLNSRSKMIKSIRSLFTDGEQKWAWEGFGDHNLNPVVHMVTRREEHRVLRLIGVDWKSLVRPACLPITTDYFPDASAIKKSYHIHSYNVAVFSTSQEDATFGKPRRSLTPVEAFRELVNQRIAQGFQIVVPIMLTTMSLPVHLSGVSSSSNVNVGATSKIQASPTALGAIRGSIFSQKAVSRKQTQVAHRLSFGSLHHILTLDNEDIKVTQYRPVEMCHPVNLSYNYRLKVPDSDHYVFSMTSFCNQPLEKFSWNYLDGYICTRGEDDTYGLVPSQKYWKSRFVVLPLQNPGTKKIQDAIQEYGWDNVVADVYQERCEKELFPIMDSFIKFTQSINKLQRKPKKQSFTYDFAESATVLGGPMASGAPRAAHSQQQLKTPTVISGLTTATVVSASNLSTTTSNSSITSMTSTVVDCPTTFGSHLMGIESLPHLEKEVLCINSPLNQMASAMLHPLHGVSFIQNPSTFPPNTFVAFEAVYWMISNVQGVDNVQRACQILQSMCRNRLICHGSGNTLHQFLHGFYLYYICENSLSATSAAFTLPASINQLTHLANTASFPTGLVSSSSGGSSTVSSSFVSPRKTDTATVTTGTGPSNISTGTTPTSQAIGTTQAIVAPSIGGMTSSSTTELVPYHPTLPNVIVPAHQLRNAPAIFQFEWMEVNICMQTLWAQRQQESYYSRAMQQICNEHKTHEAAPSPSLPTTTHSEGDSSTMAADRATPSETADVPCAKELSQIPYYRRLPNHVMFNYMTLTNSDTLFGFSGNRGLVVQDGVLHKKVTVDIDVNENTDRVEWGTCQYHANYHANYAFQMEVQWLVATGGKLSDVVGQWRRKAEAYSLLFVPIPCDAFALPYTTFSDPLRQPIFIPLRVEALTFMDGLSLEESPEPAKFCKLAYFMEWILKRYGFMRDSCVSEDWQVMDAVESLGEDSHSHHSVEPPLSRSAIPSTATISGGVGSLSSTASSIFHSKTWYSTPHLSYIHCTGGMFVLVSCPKDESCLSDSKLDDYVTAQAAIIKGKHQISQLDRVGFLWSWNFMLTKRWRNMHTGDESFQDALLKDFRRFCNNVNGRLISLWRLFTFNRTACTVPPTPDYPSQHHDLSDHLESTLDPEDVQLTSEHLTNSASEEDVSSHSVTFQFGFSEDSGLLPTVTEDLSVDVNRGSDNHL